MFSNNRVSRRRTTDYNRPAKTCAATFLPNSPSALNASLSDRLQGHIHAQGARLACSTHPAQSAPYPRVLRPAPPRGPRWSSNWPEPSSVPSLRSSQAYGPSNRNFALLPKHGSPMQSSPSSSTLRKKTFSFSSCRGAALRIVRIVPRTLLISSCSAWRRTRPSCHIARSSRRRRRSSTAWTRARVWARASSVRRSSRRSFSCETCSGDEQV